MMECLHLGRGNTVQLYVLGALFRSHATAKALFETKSKRERALKLGFSFPL